MSKALLALTFPGALTPERRAVIVPDLEALAERIGAESVVLEAGAAMALHTDLAPVVDAIQAQTAAVHEHTAAVRLLSAQVTAPKPTFWQRHFRWWADDNPGAAAGPVPVGVLRTPAPPPGEL